MQIINRIAGIAMCVVMASGLAACGGTNDHTADYLYPPAYHAPTNGSDVMQNRTHRNSITRQKTGPYGATTQGIGDQAAINGKNLKADDFGYTTQAPANQTVHFAFNKSKIDSKYVEAILAQANYLSEHPTSTVRIEGHTDPIGSREYNVALGWRRAKALQQALEQQGVAPKQIAVVSFGSEKPAVTGTTNNDYFLDRRDELIYQAY